jgi:4-amino-4-deoxy-L-arabinose transferase-like glycosyltransferase
MFLKERIQKLNNRQKYSFIFCSFLLVRLVFIFVLKTYLPEFEVLPDSVRYDRLSTNILNGNFNLDCGLFLVAPVYPYFLALVKSIFGSSWEITVAVIQIGLGCLSGVYFYKFGKLLFESERVAILATLGYCFYPFTMWYLHVVSQETIYQTFLIFSMYYFVLGLKYQKNKHLIYSAILFSICFLTKSIILFLSPFLALLIYLYLEGGWKKKIQMVVVYASICVAFTIPNGVYNLVNNGVYTLSSDGIGFFFSLSNSRHMNQMTGVYKFDKNLNGFDFLYGHEFEFETNEELRKITPSERNKGYFKAGFAWIKNNPKDWAKMCFTKMRQFLMPGFSIAHHPFKKWLLSFIVALPVFLFGYIGIYKGVRENFMLHGWMLFLFISMLFFCRYVF